MRRLLLLLALAAALAVAVAACGSNQPCLWHSGIERSHLSYDGHTLLLICRDGTVIARHQ